MTLENDFNTLIGEMEDNLQAMGVLDAEFDPTTGLRGLTARILDIEPSIGGLDLDTAVNITANPSTIIVGQSVILTSKLTASYDDETIVDVDLTGVLTGATIQYKEGNTVLGTAVTDNNGIATCTVSGLTLGTHTVKAVFQGTENFNDCESSNITITVNNPEPASLTLAKTGGKQILSYADRFGSGEFCELTCTVLDAEGNPLPSILIDVYKNNVFWHTLESDNAGEITILYESEGAGDVEFYAECGSLVTETYSIEDCIRYDSTDYVNVDAVKNWDLPSEFKLSFIIRSDSWSGSSGSMNAALIRFNSSTGVWCGKGSSSSRTIYAPNGVTLNSIPANTDVEYTLTYDNGNCSFTDGTSTVTTTASLTKLYMIGAQESNHAHLKNIKIKPL